MKREFSPASLVYSPVGFNIESLAVGPAEQEGAEFTMVVPGDDRVIEQLTKPLQASQRSRCRTLPKFLRRARINAAEGKCNQLLPAEIVNWLRRAVVDGRGFAHLRVVGDPGMVAIVQVLCAREALPTGKVALTRESGEYRVAQVPRGKV